MDLHHTEERCRRVPAEGSAQGSAEGAAKGFAKGSAVVSAQGPVEGGAGKGRNKCPGCLQGSAELASWHIREQRDRAQLG